jgi:hypothetical protein
MNDATRAELHAVAVRLSSVTAPTEALLHKHMPVLNDLIAHNLAWDAAVARWSVLSARADSPASLRAARRDVAAVVADLERVEAHAAAAEVGTWVAPAAQ